VLAESFTLTSEVAVASIDTVTAAIVVTVIVEVVQGFVVVSLKVAALLTVAGVLLNVAYRITGILDPALVTSTE
jgi:hypothetical protein